MAIRQAHYQFNPHCTARLMTLYEVFPPSSVHSIQSAMLHVPNGSLTNTICEVAATGAASMVEASNVCVPLCVLSYRCIPVYATDAASMIEASNVYMYLCAFSPIALYSVTTFNTCTKCVGSTGIIHDHTPKCHPMHCARSYPCL